MKLLVALVLVFAQAHGAAQDVYFGDFPREPTLRVVSNDHGRPTFELLTDFVFNDPNGFAWKTPSEAEVDGASIPRFFWSYIGGPMSGKFLYASIIHDHYCNTKERTAHDTHRNFYYGMRAKGVGEAKANLMYFAVRAFGPDWEITRYGIETIEMIDVSDSSEQIRNLVTMVSDKVAQPETKIEGRGAHVWSEFIEEVGSFDGGGETKDVLDKLDFLSLAIRSEMADEQGRD